MHPTAALKHDLHTAVMSETQCMPLLRLQYTLCLRCRAELQVQNTVVGSGKQDYMHGIVGGAADAPPLVCLPGYGAGAAFFFRNFPSLCQHFRTYAVDPLGTGMSGQFGLLLAAPDECIHQHC